MFEEEDRATGYALFLVIALAIAVAIFTIGIAAGTAISQRGGKPAASAAELPVAVSVEAAAVRLYFELGKSELPTDALAQLAPLLNAAKATGTAQWIISGYHDASGNPEANAELAKQRALAVRDLLTGAGVRPQSIELSKPMVTMGGADPREARRVEVSLR